MANESVTVSLEVVDKATKAIEDVVKKLDKLNDTAKQGTSGFKQFGAVFSGVFAADVALKAIGAITNAATKLFDVFIVDGVHAAEEAQDGLNKLSTAFALAGQDAAKASKDFALFAEALQNTTKFSDDAIVEAGALLESLSRLDEEGLKKATSAAIDMSAALGIDLDSAVRLVGKAANGNVEAFKRYGVEIRKGRDDAESLSNTLEVLNARFGGSAAAQLNTFGGSVARLANIFNNLQEAFGSVIVENQAVINVIKEIGTIVDEVTKEVSDHKNEYKALVADALIITVSTLRALLTVMNELEPVFRKTANGVQILGDSIASGPGILLKALKFDIDGAKASLAEFAKRMQGDVKDGLKKDTFQPAIDALGRIEIAAENGLDAIKVGSDGATTGVKGTTKALKEFNDEQIRAGEEGKKYIESLTKLSPLDEYKAKLEQISQAYQQNKITAEQAADGVSAATEKTTTDQIASLQKRNESLSAIGGQANLIEVDQNNAKIETLLAQENARVNQLAEIKSSANLDELNSETIKGDLLIENQARTSNEILAIQAKQAQTERALREKNINSLSNSFGQIATLTQTKNRELFEIGKAAAIAQATIGLYTGVANALAGPPTGPPFPLNFIAATAQAVASGVQIANIAAQTLNSGTSFVQGTNVGNRDSVPALLTVGERVVSRDQNSDLTSFLDSQDDTKEILFMIADAVSRDRPINVSVGGEQIFNAVNEQVRSGRAFAS